MAQMFNSLRFRMIALVLLVIIPAMGLAAYNGQQNKKAKTAEAITEANRLTSLIANDQKVLIEAAHQLLVVLSHADEITSFDPQRCSQFLVGLRADYPVYTNLGVADANGDIFCSAIPMASPVNIADRGYFQRVMANGTFAIGEYQVGRITGLPAINLAFPVYDLFSKQITGVVYVALGLEWIGKMAHEAVLPEGSVITVMDSTGTILVRYPDSDSWVGNSFPGAPIMELFQNDTRNGTAEIQGLDGVLRLYEYENIGSSGDEAVFVVVGFPSDYVFGSTLKATRINMYGLGMVGLLVMILATIFSSKFILHPVRRLVDVSRQMAAGNLDVRTGIPGGTREFSQLGQAFDQMVSSIKEKEESIQTSAARFQAMIQNLHDLIVVIDPNGKLTFISPSVERMLGYQPQEMIGRNCFDLVHPTDLPSVKDIFFQKIQEPGSTAIMEARIRHKDGSWRVTETTAVNLVENPHIRGMILTLRDITEHKQVDEKLTNEHNLLRTVIDNLPDYIFAKDRDNRFILSNMANALLVGAISPEQLLGKDDFVFFPQEIAEIYLANEQKVIQSGKPMINFEEPSLEEDGKRKWVSTTQVPLRDTTGEIIGLVGIGRDITERKQADAQLRESEEKYRTLFENVPNGVYRTTPEGKILAANPALVQMLGYDSEADFRRILSTDLYVDPQDHKDFVEVLQENDEIKNMEIRLKRKDGQEIIVLDNAITVRDETGNIIYLEGTMIDITERKQMTLDIQKRNQEINLLYEAGKKMGRTLDLGDTYQNIHDIIAKVMPCDGMVISSYDPEDRLIRCVRFWSGEVSLDVSEFPPIPLNREVQGTQSRVVLSGQSIYLPDYLTYKKTGKISYYVNEDGLHDGVPEGEEDITRSALIVPLLLENQVRGVIQVFSNQLDNFTEGNLKFLEALSPQVAAAIANAILYQQTELQVKHIQALRNIDISITASFDVRITLNVILEQSMNYLGIDAMDILLLNLPDYTLEFAAGRGFRSEALQHTHLRLGDGYAGRVASERCPIFITNLAETDNDLKRSPLFVKEEFKGYYALPLITKGQVKGVMEIFQRSPLPLTQEWQDDAQALAIQAAIAIDNTSLYDDLQRSNVSLSIAYDATLEGWAKALELRDHETEGHSRRVAEMTMRLARIMGVRDNELVHIYRGTLLHDIGKMGVPDHILQKPGPLTDEEWVIMRQHPTFAYQMLLSIEYLHSSLDIPYCHHERWDGTGYPRGLKGEEIPLPARIFAVVDVWDALTSDRPYRQAWSKAKARQHIESQSGKHFDPEVVKVCLDLGLLDS